MRVLIVGAGAVGSVLGARLTAAGRSVVLLTRTEHARAIRSDGLRVDGVQPGTFRVPVVSELRDAPDPDALIVAVKTFDLPAAAALVGSALSPRPVLLVQNGLGVRDRFVGAVRAAGWEAPEKVVVRAVQSVPATLLGPGHVLAAGTGEIVLPAPSASVPASEAVGVFRSAFEGTGIPVRLSDDLARDEWRKALVNAAVNPVTAVHHVRNGALARGPLREEALRLLEEARRVAASTGVVLEPAEARAEFDRVVAATSENTSSMLQDLERGRPTEIDAISGEILRQGRARGLALPATEAAVRRVEELVARAPSRPQPP